MSGQADFSGSTTYLSPDSDDESIDLQESQHRARLRKQTQKIMLDISRSANDPKTLDPYIKQLIDIYHDNPLYRRELGDVLSCTGFVEFTYSMLATLKNFYEYGWMNRKPSKRLRNVIMVLQCYSKDCAEVACGCARSCILEILNVILLNTHSIKNPNSESYEMFKTVLTSIYNIARHPENKHYFKKGSFFRVLMKYIESSDNFVKVVTLITLAYIADAREAHLLTKDASTIQTIVHWMYIAIDIPEDVGFTASELARALEKLTIDGNTEMILESKAINTFQRMLVGSLVEDQISAAKCIWTLGMNEGARQRIIKEKSIIKSLERIKKNERNKELLDCVGSALWTLKDDTRKPQSVDQSAEQHVFISYHERDKETVRKIWSRLRQENYKVWVDMDKMPGELLEAMSSAVDNSSVVILCMSENYKQDNNCRSEARYTYKQEKQFIPLKMQRPFSNDGWLGMMTGTKTIYDFSDEAEFEENMSKLLYDLEKNVGKPRKENLSQPEEFKPTTQQPQTRPPSSTSTNVEKIIRNMSRSDVWKWLSNIGLGNCRENFKKVDGDTLWHLKELKVQDAVNYEEVLNEDFKLTKQQISKLTEALDDFTLT